MKKLHAALAVAALMMAGSAHAEPKEFYEQVREECKPHKETVQCMLAKYRTASREDANYMAAYFTQVFEHMGHYKAANEYYEMYKLAVTVRTPGQALKLAYDVGVSYMVSAK